MVYEIYVGVNINTNRKVYQDHSGLFFFYLPTKALAVLNTPFQENQCKGLHKLTLVIALNQCHMLLTVMFQLA